jgi:hypothetical protein
MTAPQLKQRWRAQVVSSGSRFSPTIAVLQTGHGTGHRFAGAGFIHRA